MDETMQNQIPLTHRIRKLLAEENTDINWLFEVSKLSAIDPKYLETQDWYKRFWRKEWGEIEKVEGEIDAIAWHRPDGGPSLANVDPIPDNVKAVKFCLMAMLIPALRAEGQLSYAKVGEGTEWMYAKILLGGQPITQVVEADALVGWARVMSRDKMGKVVLDKEKGEIVHHKVTGSITIILEKESQTIF